MFYSLIIYLVIQNLILDTVISYIDFREEEDKEVEYYTNTWAVRILGGVSKARKIALKLGFDPHIEVSQKNREVCNIAKKHLLIACYVVQVSEGLPNFYLFRNSMYPEKMKQADEDFMKKLRGKEEVRPFFKIRLKFIL